MCSICRYLPHASIFFFFRSQNQFSNGSTRSKYYYWAIMENSSARGNNNAITRFLLLNYFRIFAPFDSLWLFFVVSLLLKVKNIMLLLIHSEIIAGSGFFLLWCLTPWLSMSNRKSEWFVVANLSNSLIVYICWGMI